MNKFVEKFRRGMHSATHLAVLLILLASVASMHVALSSPADAAPGGLPAAAVHMDDLVQAPAPSSTVSDDAQEVDERMPPTLPSSDDDHHGAVIVCCLLALSGIASLVVRRSGQCLCRTLLTTVVQHTARDIAVVIEGCRPPVRPRFALGVIRT